jgi:hypothetical protein
MVSPDQLTRFLASEEFTSKELWKRFKPIARQVESDDGVLIFSEV